MTPDEYTVQELMLDVGEGHELYVHEWGNKSADAVILFLHGGPGAGCSDKHKSLFDPTKQRVIFFDQRGCGKSLPYGSIEHNTTKELVEDISRVLDHFKLEKVILTGGSWGSALALFYAVANPTRVAALVLDGIWTCRKSENDWVDKGGFRTFLPDVWANYVSTVPKEFSDNPSKYHFARILGDNPLVVKKSAYAYSNLEGAAVALDDRFVPEIFETFDPTGIRMEVSTWQTRASYQRTMYLIMYRSSPCQFGLSREDRIWSVHR